MKTFTVEHVRQIEAATRRREIFWRAGERSTSGPLPRVIQKTSYVADLSVTSSNDVKLEFIWTCRQTPPAPQEDEFQLQVTAVRPETGVRIGTLFESAERSLLEAIESSIGEQIATVLETALAGISSSSPFDLHWMKVLDVPHWRSLFHDTSGHETLDESQAVRWEQWFIATETCVFVLRDKPGEPWNHVAMVEADPGGLKQVRSLAELLPFTRDVSPASIHPVLLDYEEQHPYEAMRAKNGVPG